MPHQRKGFLLLCYRFFITLLQVILSTIVATEYWLANLLMHSYSVYCRFFLQNLFTLLGMSNPVVASCWSSKMYKYANLIIRWAGRTSKVSCSSRSAQWTWYKSKFWCKRILLTFYSRSFSKNWQIFTTHMLHAWLELQQIIWSTVDISQHSSGPTYPPHPHGQL